MDKNRLKKKTILAAKIALGSSAAIYVAEMLGLQYASAAGSVALLTIVTTKWETVRLSLLRVVTFFISVLLMGVLLHVLRLDYLAYGAFIFILVLMCEMLGWKSAISVNAVIATHFVAFADYSYKNILNEFILVVIGISVAIILNLFNDTIGHKRYLIRAMRYTEEELKNSLAELGAYLAGEELDHSIWERIIALEKKVHGFVLEAEEFQNNSFQTHPAYYADYFEMRLKQCTLLHNLHYEMRKIRNMPEQGRVISDFVCYLVGCISEVQEPTEQLRKLQETLDMLRQQALPKSREEFENRAILYHILMDMEDFLVYKKKFVENMDITQKKIYWKQHKELRN